jgi:pSer/pThr/pTyr-binding forkhead associated (FHA) protein
MAEKTPSKPGAVSVPALIPVEGRGGPAALARPFILIGSRSRAHVRLVSESVSRNHACIIADDGRHYVRDLASRAGVVVNGRRVKEADLCDGDTVQIGPFKFAYVCPETGPTEISAGVVAVLGLERGITTPLDIRTVLIGRRGNVDIPLASADVSNSHALIYRVGSRHNIRDLGSRTGTFVNGAAVHQQRLEFGDEIRVGDTILRYLPAVLEEAVPAVAEPEAQEESIGIDFDWDGVIVAEGQTAPQEPAPWVDGDGRVIQIPLNEVPEGDPEPEGPELEAVEPEVQTSADGSDD